MKKFIILTFLLLFTLAIGSSSIYAEIETELEELKNQQERIEQIRATVFSFFALAEKSDQKEIIESVLNEVLEKVDTIEEEIENRIQEREEEKRLKIIETTDDWKELTEAFLEEPTLDNFEIFCEKAKEVDGPETKEVLSDDRTEMVTISKKFYESLYWCQEYLLEENYFFANNQDNKHTIEFHNYDTDEIRKFKIEYNNKIKDNNFFAFHNRACSDCFRNAEDDWQCDYSQTGKDPVLHFNYCVNTIKELEIKHDSTGFVRNINPSQDIISGIEGMLGRRTRR